MTEVVISVDAYCVDTAIIGSTTEDANNVCAGSVRPRRVGNNAIMQGSVYVFVRVCACDSIADVAIVTCTSEGTDSVCATRFGDTNILQ